MVAEDDEREVRSREGGSRGLRSRERVGAAASAATAAASPERYGGRFASDGDENWGHVTAHVGLEAGTHPQRSTGSRERGGSPVRPSILEGLPPDPFKPSGRTNSDLIAALTDSSEDESDAVGGERHSPLHGMPQGGGGRAERDVLCVIMYNTCV